MSTKVNLVQFFGALIHLFFSNSETSDNKLPTIAAHGGIADHMSSGELWQGWKTHELHDSAVRQRGWCLSLWQEHHQLPRSQWRGSILTAEVLWPLWPWQMMIGSGSIVWNTDREREREQSCISSHGLNLPNIESKSIVDGVCPWVPQKFL